MSCLVYRRRLLIRSTAQLLQLLHQLQHAQAAGRLRCETLDADRGALVPLPCATLLAGGPLPDIVQLRFSCAACSQLFVLLCDTRHGAGGQWWVSGRLPSDRDKSVEAWRALALPGSATSGLAGWPAAPTARGSSRSLRRTTN